MELLLHAPLGGNIFSIEYTEGSRIKEDDTVIVLEAMKMETTIKTPKNGTIKKIFVKNGDKVQSGEPLFEVVELMSLIEFFSTLGIFSITLGQSIMLASWSAASVYLAINKKFEPLLLLPIGFGALLTNIPEIGLSMSPIEKLIYANDVSEIDHIITTYFGNGNDLTALLKNASYVDLKFNQ